jgi:hypothetical protein
MNDISHAAVQPTSDNGGTTSRRAAGKLSALCEEVTRLRAALEEVTAERDAYRRSLAAATWKRFDFTKEELTQIERDGITLGAVITEIEQEVAGQKGSQP